MSLYIVGAGGLGRETYDAVLAGDGAVEAFVDERLAGRRCRGLPVLHPDELPASGRFVVSVADPRTRRRLAILLAGRGLAPVTVVHPRACIGPETELGAGSVILAHVYISSEVRIGQHVHLNYNATIGHDTVVGAFVTVLPGANVAGGVALEDDVTIGSNATVLQGRRVGQGSIIGAGAVLTRSCAAAQVMVGVPARPQASGPAG